MSDKYIYVKSTHREVESNIKDDSCNVDLSKGCRIQNYEVLDIYQDNVHVHVDTEFNVTIIFKDEESPD